MGEERRLAAILAADMVGYSRLMEQDELGTITRQKAYRNELLDPEINKNNGRIVKTTGDGMLVEFASVVDATNCAIAIQTSMAESEADVTDDHRIQYRIGINVGDIIIDGDDIFGDGVNIASRIESLCRPGEICLSSSVHEQIIGKLGLSFEDLGVQNLKNISRPIQIFRVSLDIHVNQFPTTNKKPNPDNFLDKPVITVLPLKNLSGDPEQEFISDGLSEDVITALSFVKIFMVTARSSSFKYKGRSPDIREVASEFGSRYVVEGSVRKFENRLRVSVQLVDAPTNSQIWAERYDKDYKDLFEVQDDITESIIGRLEPELNRAEFERSRSIPTENLNAWELYHRAMNLFYKRSKENNLSARELFKNAIELEPEFSQAYAGVALTYEFEALISTSRNQIYEMLDAARKAVKFDNRGYLGYNSLGMALLFSSDIPAAIRAFERSIELNPYNATTYGWYGNVLIAAGRAEEAVEKIELAIRLSPGDPSMGPFYGRMCRAKFYTGQYEDALEWGEKAFERAHAWPARAAYCAALAHLGRLDEAKEALAKLIKQQPGINQTFISSATPSRIHKPYFDDLIEGLRLAGLPDD